MYSPADKPVAGYRPDLDGLRSLAILPVVLYHYGLGMLSGGFVGVDVFFVISGFLITSLLLREIDAGKFSMVRFYERRARRILPALFFVLAVTTALAVLVLLPIDLENYGKSLVATAGFSSNVFFWREFGYFDRAAELKPLLHTWSLSVEEQFYILFPPFLLLIARLGRRRLVATLVVCLAGSLVLSVLAITRWPAAGFYLPVTRAWELLIGALLAAGAVPIVANRRLRNGLSLVGIGLILFSAVSIEKSMAFPGWLAALPCLGAGLVIQTGLSGEAIGNRILRWKPLVAIGLMSYSLYLWHWPLLVLAKYAANRELTLPELLVILLMTFGLAFVSWRYVERPFRGRQSAVDRKRIFQLAGAGSATMLACGAMLIVFGGLPSRLPPAVLRYAQVASEDLAMKSGCFNPSAEDVRADKLCTIGADPKASPSFLVWGDSHASRIALPIAEIARSEARFGVIAAVGSCPPLLDVDWPVQGCRRFNTAVLEMVKRQGIGTVFLSGMWANYAEGIRFKRGLGEGTVNILSDEFSQHQGVEENSVVFARALRRTVEHLIMVGARVVVIGPVPEIEAAVPEALAKAEWFGGRKNIGPSDAEFKDRQRHVFAALAAVAGIGDTTVVYPSAVSCAADCSVERGGRVLYIDDNHLSRAGLELLKPMLQSVFDRGERVPQIVAAR